jgi:hypothetical protein
MNIELHIERLVLDGVSLSRVQAQQMQGVLEVELTRLLSESGLAPQLLQGGAFPSLRGGDVGGFESPHGLGQQVAQTVYEEVGGKRE